MVVNVARETTDRPEDTLPVYEASDLTHGGDLARIKHKDQLYTLRITRAGKLILTK
ncbi:MULTISPECIES: hemin uptake protein HemP [unclassified Tateyamaria]|uniref:hemin uptake protein HemP n=1 Tax=unclassified Tateyamaria TaxID=2645127 RepID=UPI000D560DA2|nr:hemin uptake protein HemP [Tateyamaria sp. Alg231-49]